MTRMGAKQKTALATVAGSKRGITEAEAREKFGAQWATKLFPSLYQNGMVRRNRKGRPGLNSRILATPIGREALASE